MNNAKNQYLGCGAVRASAARANLHRASKLAANITALLDPDWPVALRMVRGSANTASTPRDLLAEGGRDGRRLAPPEPPALRPVTDHRRHLLYTSSQTRKTP